MKQVKLQNFLSNFIPGVVATAKALHKRGFSYDLLKKYKTHNWIETVGYGAYKRPGDEVRLPGGIYALQNDLGLTCHPGARTSLDLLGHAHYLRTDTCFHLFGKQSEILPGWFKSYEWKQDFNYHSTNLFSDKDQLGLQEYKYNNFTILISSRERAVLEMLSFVPNKFSFEESSFIMEHSHSFVPGLVQELLESCTSIKAKRLFLYFAELHELKWFEFLNPSRINLGSGKRQIVKNGHLDKKYRITVSSVEDTIIP